MSEVFLFSPPRSGSTLAMRCLQVRAEISLRGESPSFLWRTKAFAKCYDEHRKKLPSLTMGYEHLAEKSDFGGLANHIGATPDSIALMVRAMIKFWANPSENERLWGWKEVRVGSKHIDKGVELCEWILQVMPNAKIIFLTREIDEVVTSLMEMNHCFNDYGDSFEAKAEAVARQLKCFSLVHSKFPSRTTCIEYSRISDWKYWKPLLCTPSNPAGPTPR